MMQDIFDFILDIVLWIPRKLYEWFVDAVETMMGWLPDVPIGDLSALINGVGGDILYYLTVFQFGYGITAVLTAYIARFILRRIPGIG